MMRTRYRKSGCSDYSGAVLSGRIGITPLKSV
jgi:hypothetical protein